MGKARVDLNSVTTVGLDLAKHVFQIHAVDADGGIVITAALRRKDVLSFFGALPPCLVGHPTPNGLVGHRHSAFRQQFLDVTQAKGEPE